MVVRRLSASVGRGGVNKPGDVKVLQELLNENLPIPYRPLIVNGSCGQDTIDVIVDFQRRVMLMGQPDGRVDAGGRTFKVLTKELPPPTPSSNKPFPTRVAEFRAHVKSTLGIDIRIHSDLRGAAWQQRVHVAHMIKFNSFASLKPKKSKLLGGRNLVDFAHLADPKVTWAGEVTAEDFLRDKDGKVCRRKSDGTGHDNTPDEAKTRARALEILSGEGVATAKDRSTEPHSAMVAPGVQGCAEPCACGGNRSRHLAGLAVDLDRTALAAAKAKLTPATDAQLDRLLGEFGLVRPMASEPWHVEPK